MTEIQAEVWSFLLTRRHAGEENAMPRAAILTRFNLVRRKPISDRMFREIVSELVTVYKKAICTTPARGYFVARTVAEKNHAINYLDLVLTEVGDQRRALAGADPLARQLRMF